MQLNELEHLVVETDWDARGMIGKSKLAPVMFIAWMLPDAFSCDEVEIVNVSCWALTARHNGLDLQKRHTV